MAADYSAYDAGTAYLTIESQLAPDFREKLRAQLESVDSTFDVSAVPNMERFTAETEAALKALDYEVHVPISPNLDRFGEELDAALKAMDFELRVPVAPDMSTFDEKVRAELDAVGGLHIPVEADLTRADAQLAEFFSLIPILEIPVVLDTTVAQLQMEELRASGGTITVNTAGGGGAGSELARMGEEAEQAGDKAAHAAQQINILAGIQLNSVVTQLTQINVSMQEVGDHSEQTGNKAQSAVSKFFGLKAMSMGELLSALKSVSAMLDEIGSKALLVGGIGAGMGLLGGMAAGLAGIGAAAAIGAHGLAGAFQAQSALNAERRDPSKQIDRTQQVLSAQTEQRTSAEGLANSQWAVSDALFSAGRAQEQLTQAQTSAKLAQMDLNQAYIDASRNVRDMNDALIDAQLNQEGSALAVARARQQMLLADMNPGSTILDREDKTHAYNVAVQRYAESKSKTSDARVNAAQANERGVDGSKTVIAAQQGMRAATEGVVDAVHGIADSQHAVQVAFQGVQSAEDRVTQATLNMQKVMLGTQAETALNAALSRLSANARDFFNQLQSLAPSLRDLRQSVSNNMFAGLGESFTQLAHNQMPAFKNGMDQIATGINVGLKGTFGDLDVMFSKLVDSGTMQKFINGINTGLTGLGPLVAGVTEGFIRMGAQIGPQIGPLLSVFGTAFAAMSPALGQLGAALAGGLTQILPAITPLVNALTLALLPVMPILVKLVQEFARVLTDNAPAIGKLAELLLTKMSAGLRDIAGILPAISGVLNFFLPMVIAHPGVFMAVFAGWESLKLIRDGINGIAGGFQAFKDARDVVKGAVTAVKEFEIAQKLAALATKAWTVVQTALDVVMNANPIGLIVIAIGALIAGIVLVVTHWKQVTEAWDWTYKNVLTPVGNWFQHIWSDDIVPAFHDSMKSIHDFFSDMGAHIENVWDGIVRSVANAIESIGKLIQKIPNLPGIANFGDMGKGLVTWAQDEAKSHPGGHVGQHMAAGGRVSGPGGPRADLVPAMLSDGEFVVHAEAAARFMPLLEAINSGRLPGFADGGDVDPSKFNQATDGQAATPALPPLPTTWTGGAGSAAELGLKRLLLGDKAALGGNTDDLANQGATDLTSQALLTAAGGYAKAADTAASGFLGDALKVFGVQDEMPGWLQAGMSAKQLMDSGQWDKKIPKVDASAKKPSSDSSSSSSSGTPSSPSSSTPSQPSTPSAPSAPATPSAPSQHVYDPSGGVEQWSDTISEVLATLGMPASWLGLTKAQMRTESGGNPKAINLTDSNAAAGHPSKGLMQVINPTFDMEYPKFAAKGFPNDVWDPRSNIAAGLEWVVQAYNGSPVGVWGQGHGYATGGDVFGAGSSIGDMIPSFLSNREFVVNARSADANRPLLHAINQDASAVSKLVRPQAIPARQMIANGGNRHTDNRMTINIQTPDTDSAFQKAKRWEAQRTLTYTAVHAIA